MLSENEIMQLSNTLTFWDKLNIKEQSVIIQNTRIKKFKKGTNVYNGGTECLGLILIRQGMLRTYMMSSEGKDITLYRLYANDCCILSASCLLNNITFDVCMDAEQDTELFLIPANLFSQIMSSNIHVENFTYKLTIDRFSDVMWSMEQILFMSFDQRLAIFLVDESNKTNSHVIALTHAQIAKYIGSAREVVSRMLKYFEEEGIVKLSRGGIEILDKDRLSKLVLETTE